MGGVKRDALLAERRRGGGEHARQRLLDRDHAAHDVCSCARQSPDLPPRFSIEAHALDAHAAVDRLGHVVDREAGDGDGGQRLHLDAGRADAARLRPDREAGQGLVGGDVDRDLAELQRMAERDQVGGLLGGHDPGDPRRADHVALPGVARENRLEEWPRPMRTWPSATATRLVASLSETSTMRASPSAPRWVRPSFRAIACLPWGLFGPLRRRGAGAQFKQNSSDAANHGR